ncbi:MAG: hypothetical protein KAY24_10705 [Candidatus Eisenbacteria sp.]|nr:hypothetical protein [Candidatus Eisenbacteria bacterium]
MHQGGLPKATAGLIRLLCLGGAVLGGISLEQIPAQAGPHERGVLFAHINPDLEYTTSFMDYRGKSDLRSCEDAITDGLVDPERAQIWYVMASFARSPGPIELAGIQFGFEAFDCSAIDIYEYGPCNGDEGLELSSSGWPGPEEGTSLVWGGRGSSRFPTTEVVEIYWFASYVYGRVSIELGENPDFGAYFGAPFHTENYPPEKDEIEEFGIIGFGESGYNPCRPSGALGACCVSDMCRLTTREDCEWLGGIYQGDNTKCFPSPCERYEAIETNWTTIKRLYRFYR